MTSGPFHGGTPRRPILLPGRVPPWNTNRPGPTVPRWNDAPTEGPRMGTIISLLNQKGGVGKTSSCHHLAGALAKGGHRVLLIDNDPQASLSQGFWGPDATRRIGAAESVASLYDADLSPIPEALIRPTGFDG